MNRTLGYVHFWGSLVCMNLIFFPMLIQGLAGMERRMSDGGYIYSAAHPSNEGVIGALSGAIMQLNGVIAWSALALAAFQLPFIFNFFRSAFAGRRVESDNPWQATTLEWQTPTPPPHGNFAQEMFVYREPYAYSLSQSTQPLTSTPESQGGDGEILDFETQNQPVASTMTNGKPEKQEVASE
jgi:cytochrome c oxidase subunit 1